MYSYCLPAYYALFLPAVVLAYSIIPQRFRWAVLLGASYAFFWAISGKLLVFLLIATAIIYLAGLALGAMQEKRSAAVKAAERAERKAIKALYQTKQRRVLTLAVLVLLGMLLVLKYAGFFGKNVNALLGLLNLPQNFPVLKFALPIGISFYTFQAVSYLIDVYWDDCEASHSLVNFACYISLFPQLIAGPIVRYKDVNDQLISRHETPTLFNSGVRLFMVGMAKKVLLANQFGMLWDTMSADPVAAGMLGAWAGACAYTLQIYFDFAGYSDMARGLGRMLGFEFCINFDYPYISKSVTEFWRRWHISLSTWFRDYVYIPLGGNRCGKIRQCVNILIVWALTGFWHGAGWNFLFWGFYYGVLLLIEKLVLGKYIKRLPAFFQHLYAMVIVIIGWVFFASPNLSTALAYLKVMFAGGAGTMGGANAVLPWVGMFLLGVVGSTPLAKKVWDKLEGKKAMPLAEGVLCLAGLLLCIASLVSSSYNPFLYFRF